MRRADQRTMGNWLQIRSDTPTEWFRSRNINFNQYATWNFDGDRLFSGGNVNAHATFVNNWDIGGGYNSRRSDSTIAPRAAARASTPAASRTFWHYAQHRSAPARCG